ncbi:hypothetical protein JTB14_028770 [Gonioctena quinquepunctata]|nr:hypothetical protein JTB14_028770 [Gonioctena quinquepunctata]
MKNSISELARARNDDWGQAIVERLEQVTDLVAADAQYHNSCMKKLYQTPSTEERKKRGPYASEIDTATIEQSLMRTMKCVGGLTHGRGVKESVLSKWTLGMAFLYNICDEVEKFCDDIEEEETDTILEQINDEIENEEDHDGTDDPIVDDAEETSVFDISIGIEDDENPTPGPSTRMKRRKLNKIFK